MTPLFHIINLGCKVNRVEADSIAAKLIAAGAEQGDPAEAHVVLINTCTVTGEADAKSRKALHRALRQAPHAHVIVCGCGASANAEQFKEDSERYQVIANKDAALSEAVQLLGLEMPHAGVVVPRFGEDFNTRVAIKIQDGCDHDCSYCIVPTARGPAQSLDAESVVDEVTAHVKAGAREIVLTGIDLGSYQDKSQRLQHLLSSLLNDKTSRDTYRIRLSSIELPSISDELIELIAASEGRICAHLHIPLQSGSDALLKAMRRRYDTDAYLEKLYQIKQALPHAAISTDIIVGFPGESEEDFSDTLSLCKEVGYSRMHIFRYSVRPHTPAASMPGHLAPEIIAKRAGELRDLASQLTLQDAERRIGTREQVLCESAEGGRSESYYPVRIAGSATRGNLVTMEILGYEQGRLTAREC